MSTHNVCPRWGDSNMYPQCFINYLSIIIKYPVWSNGLPVVAQLDSLMCVWYRAVVQLTYLTSQWYLFSSSGHTGCRFAGKSVSPGNRTDIYCQTGPDTNQQARQLLHKFCFKFEEYLNPRLKWLQYKRAGSAPKLSVIANSNIFQPGINN